MDTFGTRLRHERKRLGLTQDEFAQACEVAKGTQVNYEHDSRTPDASYLALAVLVGADVGYLITGQYAGSNLAEDEVTLLRRYRRQSSRNKLALHHLLASMGNESDTGEALSPADWQALQTLEIWRKNMAIAPLATENSLQNLFASIAPQPK